MYLLTAIGLKQADKFIQRDHEPGTVKEKQLARFLLSSQQVVLRENAKQWLRAICYQIDFDDLLPADEEVVGKREEMWPHKERETFLIKNHKRLLREKSIHEENSSGKEHKKNE